MVRTEYIAMNTDEKTTELLTSDLRDLKSAAKKFANDVIKLASFGIGSSFFQWLACVAAIGDPGKWISFVAVVLRLFFPKHFPDGLEMPAALVLLVVVTQLFAHTLRNSWGGVAICFAIACYLLQEHIQKSGGFKKSFTKSKGLSNSVGIFLLIVYPVWSLVLYVL
ncbi:hypothetical protein MKX01_005970 [Papaver californicum]|nr:hypothetical protein MKX01_005970 [Papaver californicum]